MTIRDFINYEILNDIYIWEDRVINNTEVRYGIACIVLFGAKNNYGFAVCRDTLYSKNKFDLHICSNSFSSLKKVKL